MDDTEDLAKIIASKLNEIERFLPARPPLSRRQRLWLRLRSRCMKITVNGNDNE